MIVSLDFFLSDGTERAKLYPSTKNKAKKIYQKHTINVHC